MKKAKIWIVTFVHLLFSSSCFAPSSEIRHIITDDDKIISLLKQNIPRDYRMAVCFIPKELSHMCWVQLNVYHLEGSLKVLQDKFGDISSNRDNLSIVIRRLQDMRVKIEYLETMMQDFACHYREESWVAEHYFDFVHDLLNSNTYEIKSEDCESPPCPPPTPPTTPTGSPDQAPNKISCNVSTTDCDKQAQAQHISEVVGKSLLILLLIPTAALIFFIYWKIKRRKEEPPKRPAKHEKLCDTILHAATPPVDQGC
ncbi:kit ligand-like isoform X2 [Brienomyrus brachyistius]|uniref:kit ligand-like isoform X2 n=1 Tax=Brienomyrus brachyistius TaxID=42636 RepID=UPI0020B1E909|nr:kit ligand-like isoform X2 [Brienomyrus brachyistius]